MNDDVKMTTDDDDDDYDDDDGLFVLERICRCQKVLVKNDVSMTSPRPRRRK